MLITFNYSTNSLLQYEQINWKMLDHDLLFSNEYDDNLEQTDRYFSIIIYLSSYLSASLSWANKNMQFDHLY